VKSRRPPQEIVGEALDKINSLPKGRCRAGFSPHAPYSTTGELLKLTGKIAREQKLHVVTHVSESHEEFEMFADGSGKMFNWIKRSGRDMSDCTTGSPIQHLEKHGLLGENLLAVHVNYLAPGDAILLAKHKVSIVHCPRSHAYFKHHAFPYAELDAAGVNLCLGTDSLASVISKRNQTVELNLFDEMWQFAAVHPEVKPQTVLAMATVNAATALGMKGMIGELAPKAFADLIAIPYSGKIAASCEAVVSHRGNVAASMIDGEWAIAPGTTPEN